MQTRSLWMSVPLTSGVPYLGGPYAAGDFIQPYYATPRANGLGCNPASDVAGGGGTIVSLTVVDNDNQGAPLDFFVFDSFNWTGPADNAPFSIANFSANECLGLVTVKSYVRHGTGLIGFATFPQGPIPYKCGDGGRTLYLGIVTRAPATYGPYPLDVRLGLYTDGFGTPLP